jgi:hypothetical protein
MCFQAFILVQWNYKKQPTPEISFFSGNSTVTEITDELSFILIKVDMERQ